MMQSLEYVLTSKVWFLESVLTRGDRLIKFTSSWVQMLAHDVTFSCAIQFSLVTCSSLRSKLQVSTTSGACAGDGEEESGRQHEVNS
jgi:hypothetical protein